MSSRPQPKFPVALLLAAAVSVLVLAGCATPNVRPFADATSAMAGASRKAGDITLAQLQRREALRPAAGPLPSAQFDASWKLRRKALNDIEAYARALAALGEASANSESNVTQVVDALKNLASNVPGYGVGFSAAGDLLVTIGHTVIEVKAYHDMAKLVTAAQPLVNEVVHALEKDLADLQILYASLTQAQLRQLKDEAEAPQTYHASLVQARNELRKAGAAILDDAPRCDKLAQLDRQIAVVEPQVAALEKAITAQRDAMSDGQLLFEQARDTLAAWLQTHQHLRSALTERRLPDLTLLADRIQELKAAVNNLHKPNPQTQAP